MSISRTHRCTLYEVLCVSCPFEEEISILICAAAAKWICLYVPGSCPHTSWASLNFHSLLFWSRNANWMYFCLSVPCVFSLASFRNNQCRLLWITNHTKTLSKSIPHPAPAAHLGARRPRSRRSVAELDRSHTQFVQVAQKSSFRQADIQRSKCICAAIKK